MTDEAIKEQLRKLNWFQMKGYELNAEGASFSGVVFDDGFDFEEDLKSVDVATEPDDAAETEKVKHDIVLPDIKEEMKKSMPPEFLGKFAVSRTTKTGWKCLHLLGACHRVPGLHYGDFQIYDEKPTADVYHGHCKQCWKAGLRPAESESEGSSSTEEES